MKLKIQQQFIHTQTEHISWTTLVWGLTDGSCVIELDVSTRVQTSSVIIINRCNHAILCKQMIRIEALMLYRHIPYKKVAV